MVNQVVKFKPKGQGHTKKQGYKNTNQAKIMNIKNVTLLACYHEQSVIICSSYMFMVVLRSI